VIALIQQLAKTEPKKKRNSISNHLRFIVVGVTFDAYTRIGHPLLYDIYQLRKKKEHWDNITGHFKHAYRLYSSIIE